MIYSSPATHAHQRLPCVRGAMVSRFVLRAIEADYIIDHNPSTGIYFVQHVNVCIVVRQSRAAYIHRGTKKDIKINITSF